MPAGKSLLANEDGEQVLAYKQVAAEPETLARQECGGEELGVVVLLHIPEKRNAGDVGGGGGECRARPAMAAAADE